MTKEESDYLDDEVARKLKGEGGGSVNTITVRSLTHICQLM